MKNEQRAELPRVKLEYASNCRAPIWHRVEVRRAQLDRVKQARVKKDAPKWTDDVCTCICMLQGEFIKYAVFLFSFLYIAFIYVAASRPPFTFQQWRSV